MSICAVGWSAIYAAAPRRDRGRECRRGFPAHLLLGLLVGEFVDADDDAAQMALQFRRDVTERLGERLDIGERGRQQRSVIGLFRRCSRPRRPLVQATPGAGEQMVERLAGAVRIRGGAGAPWLGRGRRPRRHPQGLPLRPPSLGRGVYEPMALIAERMGTIPNGSTSTIGSRSSSPTHDVGGLSRARHPPRPSHRRDRPAARQAPVAVIPSVIARSASSEAIS